MLSIYNCRDYYFKKHLYSLMLIYFFLDFVMGVFYGCMKWWILLESILTKIIIFCYRLIMLEIPVSTYNMVLNRFFMKDLHLTPTYVCFSKYLTTNVKYNTVIMVSARHIWKGPWMRVYILYVQDKVNFSLYLFTHIMAG